MSASIIPFSQTRRGIAAASGASPPKAFSPGQSVIIANYTWDRGETEVRATVVRHAGDWVHVRIPDVGSYSAHVSVVHEAPAPEAA
jgi:hypothetical protein